MQTAQITDADCWILFAYLTVAYCLPRCLTRINCFWRNTTTQLPLAAGASDVYVYFLRAVKKSVYVVEGLSLFYHFEMSLRGFVLWTQSKGEDSGNEGVSDARTFLVSAYILARCISELFFLAYTRSKCMHAPLILPSLVALRFGHAEIVCKYMVHHTLY